MSQESTSSANYDPKGETFVLEHSYKLLRRLVNGPYHATWEAKQLPFKRHVQVRLYSRFDELGFSPRALKRIQGVLESGAEGELAIDFGVIPSGEPFLVLRPPDGIDLLKYWEESSGSPTELAHLALAVAESMQRLSPRQRMEVTLDKVYVTRSSRGVEANLYCIGDQPTRAEVREMSGVVPRELTAGFPPECFIPQDEPIECAEETEAADVYRLAALLYELSQGDHPNFPRSRDVSESIARLINELANASPTVKTGSPTLDRVVDSGLKHSPGERPTLAEVIHQLTTLCQAQPESKQASRASAEKRSDREKTSLRGLLRTAIFLILLIVAVLSTYFYANRPPDEVTVLITSEPVGVWFQRLNDGVPEVVGQTPLTVELDDPTRELVIQPIFEDGEVGEAYSISPDRLQIVDSCRNLHITFDTP